MQENVDREILAWNFLKERKIATLDELKLVLNTDARMTVFRTLRRVGYYSSYSHRGSFYTAQQIPEFDDLGLWAFRGVGFSCHGNLLRTAEALVDQAKAGYTAADLESTLQVEVKHCLLALTRRGLIHRRKIKGAFVYVSADPGRLRQQLLLREEHTARAETGMGIAVDVLPEEAKAAIVLFFSLLDEQQRRLYAGLEAAKLGHGGDSTIAGLLGLDVHTVAKGRRELLEGTVSRGRVRQQGAGRKRLEKKRRE